MIQALFRIIYLGLKALVRLLFPKKESTPILTELKNDQSRLRVQFEDFTVDNFETSPIWEFALDEEGEDEQDETTLRPCFDLNVVDPAEGLYIVKAEFTTAGGEKFYGLCSPAFEFNFGDIQPYMYTDSGMISFWFGMLEPTQQTIDELYKQSGENKDSLFPIMFKSLVRTKGAELLGTIDGFMWKPIDGEKIITIK